tara:strand:- start:1281 stop:1778 length:498 start_codon:yes stop_codon:yes gene_type:complete
MPDNKNTASFMIRFTQQFFEDNTGEENVQWRGKISHIQGGKEKNFSELEDALSFIQENLTSLTLSSTSHKTKEEQDGLLSKSFDIWKKMAKNAPKMMMETIKDPQAQVANIKEQLTDVGEEIGQKLEIDSWRTASRSDIQNILSEMKSISDKIVLLDKKIDKIKS